MIRDGCDEKEQEGEMIHSVSIQHYDMVVAYGQICRVWVDFEYSGEAKYVDIHAALGHQSWFFWEKCYADKRFYVSPTQLPSLLLYCP